MLLIMAPISNIRSVPGPERPADLLLGGPCQRACSPPAEDLALRDVAHPAEPGHVSLRLPRSVTVHRDVYDDSALSKGIEQYDQDRDAQHAIARDQQRSPDRFGYADFYGWSEDKARQAASPEGAAFPVYLRAHGFTLD